MSASKIVFEIRTEMNLRRFGFGASFFSADLIIYRAISMVTWPKASVDIANLHAKLKREVQEVTSQLYKKYDDKFIPLPVVLAAILIIPGVNQVEEVGNLGMRVYRDKDVHISNKKK